MVEVKDIVEQNPWWRIEKWEEFDKHLLVLNSSFFKIKRKEIEKKTNVNLIY